MQVCCREEDTMARAKKNGTYLNICIETSIYDKLEKLCLEAGQTKTIAVERALLAYIEQYEKTQERLKVLEMTLSSEENHYGK